MLTPDRAIIDANLEFYEAFANGDVAAMASVWSYSHPISCIHPGWQILRGRDQVMSSWRAILGNAGAPLIRCSDAEVVVIDQVAIVTCIEHVDDGQLVATNTFAFEDGFYKLVHHQAGAYAVRPLPGEWSPPPDSLN